MEDEQYQQLYKSGFNDGYLLSQYKPDLLKQIVNGNKSESPYLKGVSAGQQTHERQLFLQSLKNVKVMNEEVRRPKMR